MQSVSLSEIPTIKKNCSTASHWCKNNYIKCLHFNEVVILIYSKHKSPMQLVIKSQISKREPLQHGDKFVELKWLWSTIILQMINHWSHFPKWTHHLFRRFISSFFFFILKNQVLSFDNCIDQTINQLTKLIEKKYLAH